MIEEALERLIAKEGGYFDRATIASSSDWPSRRRLCKAL